MLRIGVDYYPEHWNKKEWKTDVLLMKDSGVNVVRMAEFAWSRLEPEEGTYDFQWLDEAISLFERHGIDVVLGIPTMTPPQWLSQHYPDSLPDLPDQHLSHPGVRGHRCYNSPSMRILTAAITKQMAQRYGSRKSVIGWQTDNEFSLHMCRCSNCLSGFRNWLKEKYGDLKTLNQEWGTVVWSGGFSDWEQIALYPTNERYFNPSLLLDYRRFQSQSVTSYQQIQIDEIRSHSRDQWITHNTWSAPLPLDLHELYDELDFASFDYYPATDPDKAKSNPYSGALLLDRTRGFKQQNFWVMEQFGGMPGSWMPVWRSPYPGFLRAFAWQSVSRGADGVVFFRWRSAAAGAEQYWHGLIDHSNVPGRRFKEFQQFAREANRLSDQIFGSEMQHKVAILYDFDSHTALQLQPQTEGYDYYEYIKLIHRSLLKSGVGVDILHRLDNLPEEYRLLILPSLFVADEESASHIEAFVRKGGTVVALPRSGVKQMNNQCWMKPLPGPLSSIFGVSVKEYDPIGSHVHRIASLDGHSYECSYWCDLLEADTAETVASYDCDFYKGTPAVTRNKLGQGEAFYVGTFPEESYLKALFTRLCNNLDIEVYPDLPEGIHMTRRIKDGTEYVFVLNLSREEQAVSLKQRMKPLLVDDDITKKSIDSLTLSPYGVAVLEL
ncbi:beta-galactosidase [Paenibacillus lemnae]|uniref:beta-galactosidase n=1 Tax=Paenibacillus lemnae TaxID=1330551 RepID=UPI001FEAC0CE|nr:beta-galactosidase [Paenibacillus lemnae]